MRIAPWRCKSCQHPAPCSIRFLLLFSSDFFSAKIRTGCPRFPDFRDISEQTRRCSSPLVVGIVFQEFRWLKRMSAPLTGPSG